MPATLRITDELSQSLAAAVRRGVPIETAAQAAGVSQSQFYEWLKAAESGQWRDGQPVSPESLRSITAFSERIRRAQSEFEAECIQRIAEAGSMVGKSGVPEWRALAWIANNHPRYRERYRQHREVEVHQSGQVVHELKLAQQLEPQALEAAYEALHALPAETQSE